MKLLIVITFCFFQGLTFCQTILNPISKWKFQATGSIRGGAIVDKKAVYFGSSTGDLYALNKEDGELIWKFKTSAAISSTPEIFGNQIIIQSRDNFIYSVNAQSGQLIWKYQTEALLPMSWDMTWDYHQADAIVYDSKIYIGSGDGNLYVLSDKGKLLWKFQTNARLRASPYVFNNIVYQPAVDGVVYAIDATKGNLLWKFETEGTHLDSEQFGWDRNSIYSSPRIQDSLLVVGSRDGSTYCININTHKQKWKFSFGATWAMTTPIVDNNITYMGWSETEGVNAMNLLTGKEIWHFKTDGFVYSDPQFLNEQIVFGSADHKLYNVNKSDGVKLWEYETSASIFSSPCIDGNTIYIGNDKGEFSAIVESEKALLAVFHPIPATRFEKLAYTIDDNITSYFVEKNFQRLDSVGLVTFLSNRIRDTKPSVIAFTFKHLPNNVLGDPDPSKGLLRQYLDAGGKVLWMADAPNFITYDKSGTPVLDRKSAFKLLDVDFEHFLEAGDYPSVSTQEGKNWGLPDYVTFSISPVGPRGIVPLAIDEFGRATAWIKRFGVKPGSGFVYCMPWGWSEPIKESHLKILYDLAVYGLK